MVKKKNAITQCINDEKRKCNSRLNSFKEANVLVFCSCIVSITLICDSTVNLRLCSVRASKGNSYHLTLWFKDNFIYSINKFIPSLNKPTAVRPNWPQPCLWSAKKLFAKKDFLGTPVQPGQPHQSRSSPSLFFSNSSMGSFISHKSQQWHYCKRKPEVISSFHMVQFSFRGQIN